MEKRLQTVLAHAGVASRRTAAELIESGRVTVNGKVILEKGYRLDPGKSEIAVNGRVVHQEEKKYYFLFNKPGDVISTVKDTHGRRKILDYFRHVNARLYPVGRLDKDTTGAILITNDGAFANKLAHPRYGVVKEYRVTVGIPVKPGDIKRLEQGIEIDGRKTSPCRISLAGKDGPNTVYNMELHEGRKRQIKLMFEAVGIKVVALERSKYAGLDVKGLKKGEYRELNGDEIKKLKLFAGKP